ncbi:uncharacterized protein LOC101235770 isoform X1 [Hydra vulgaris]|nr:uncharacterized protein LOC101235770 isoform X1 [Hydra vulgaris]
MKAKMELTGKESTDDLKLLFSRIIYTSLVGNSSVLKINDILKLENVDKIVNILKKRSQWNGIQAFIHSYPSFFQLVEENNSVVIKPIATVEFCRDFDGKKGCIKTFCPKLHVCRHFVKGKCTFGPRCKKPHHFEGSNTRDVLRNHFLEGLSDEQLREFLCRNVQHLLEQDSINPDVPKSLEICKYYNVATGCTRDICPYIHVCRFYAEEGNCKFGNQCIRKHSIDNMHTKFLLRRYQMDNLTEMQVMTYLKIKAERREDQSNTDKCDKLSPLSPNHTPLNMGHFPALFSLPNATILQALANNKVPRKLSNSNHSPILSLPIFDDSSRGRKYSLPTPPIIVNKKGVMRNGLVDEKLFIQTMPSFPECSKIEGMPTDIQAHYFSSMSQGLDLNNKNIKNSLLDDELNLKSLNHFENSPTKSTALKPNPSSSSDSLHESFMQTILANSFEQNIRLYDNTELSCDRLGLHNLSPPTTNFNYEKRKFQHGTSENSEEFEQFPAENDILPNGHSTSFSQINYSLKSNNALNSEDTSLFSSYYTNSKASTSDFYSSLGSGASFSFQQSKEDSPTNNEQAYRDRKFVSDILDSTNLITSHNTQHQSIVSEQTNGNVANSNAKVNCICQQTVICTYYIKGRCLGNPCPKLHSEEIFQWQVYTTPLKSINNLKNEKEKGKWINIGTHENLKLESDYCSAEIEHSKIDLFGTTVTVKFEEMVAVGISEINANFGSYDLSSWLLQAIDDYSIQDNVVYKMRRLSTPSSMVEYSDLSFSTVWLWYWEDNFGMWRSYPSSNADLIETNKTCLIKEIESKFMEGHVQYTFVEKKTKFDFNAMYQINYQSGKHIKIRRRPKFAPQDYNHETRTDFIIGPENVIKKPQQPWNGHDLVPLQEMSDIYNTVANRFKSYCNEYEILSIIQLQNKELWGTFVRFRNMLMNRGLRTTEKYVFKPCLKKDLAAVFQQGFPVCTCITDYGKMPLCNTFTSDPHKIKLDHKITNDDPFQYTFCARMTISLSDIKENGFNDFQREAQDSSTSPDLFFYAHNTNQVYPEFLIVFKS